MNRSTDRSTDEAEIRNLIESWAKAVRAENLKDVLANHSSKILMFDLPGPTQLKGIDAYKESWLPLFTSVIDPKQITR